MLIVVIPTSLSEPALPLYQKKKELNAVPIISVPWRQRQEVKSSKLAWKNKVMSQNKGRKARNIVLISKVLILIAGRF